MRVGLWIFSLLFSSLSCGPQWQKSYLSLFVYGKRFPTAGRQCISLFKKSCMFRDIIWLKCPQFVCGHSMLEAFPSLCTNCFWTIRGIIARWKQGDLSHTKPLNSKWVKTEMHYFWATQIFGASKVISKSLLHNEERTDKHPVWLIFTPWQSIQISSEHSTNYWAEHFHRKPYHFVNGFSVYLLKSLQRKPFVKYHYKAPVFYKIT